MKSSVELGRECHKLHLEAQKKRRRKGGTAKRKAAPRVEEVKPLPKKEKDNEALLTMEQLIEALMRLALQLFVYSGGKAKGSENPYIRADIWQAGLDERHVLAKVFRPPKPAGCFQRLLDEYLWPASHDSPDIVAKEASVSFQDLTEDNPKIEAALETNRRYLRKIFRFYCDSDSGLKNVSARVKGSLGLSSDVAADAMSVVEFLWMGQELDFSKAFNLSAPIMIQVFINSNLEEVEDYVAGVIAGDLQELLQMNFEEFELALLQLAKRLADAAPSSSKQKELSTMLQFFTDKMVDNFPHERLRDGK